MKKKKWNKLYGPQTCMKNTHHTSRNSSRISMLKNQSRDIMMLFCWIGKNCDNHSKMFILKQQYKNT